jgi:hypothetical protein
MSRHADDKAQTPAYRDAVAALQRLIAEDGHVQAAVADALEDYHHSIWVKNGYQPNYDRLNIWDLPGVKNRPVNAYELRDQPPGTDHPVVMHKNGRPALYVSEPYDLDKRTVREMINFADGHGLSFRVESVLGLHYPGRCFQVLWSVATDVWSPRPGPSKKGP